MKSKKRLTITTGGISVVALLLILALGKESNCVIYDISLAIFGSALLGAIMSLTEYFGERRKSMEMFWEEAQKIITQFKKIRYIQADAPHELILACFIEKEHNNNANIFNMPKTEDAKCDLISWIRKNFIINIIKEDEDDIEGGLENLFEERIKAYQSEYQKTIESYIEAAKTDMSKLSNAYGNLDFFYNKRIRNKVYSDIYKKLQDFDHRVIEETFHFNLLKDGGGKFSVCADKAYRLCQIAFTESELFGDGFSQKVVYHSLLDEIEDSLEWFRCEIYRNEKYEPIEKTPISGRITYNKLRKIEK